MLIAGVAQHPVPRRKSTAGTSKGPSRRETIASTLPLLRRITGPETARSE